MARLSREIVNALLLGPRADGRLVHDSPIRGDVWAGLAAAPNRPIDILIEAYRETPSGLVAARLAERLYGPETVPQPFLLESDSKPRRARSRVRPTMPGYGISFLEGFVTARLSLDEIAYQVLPFTAWAHDVRRRDQAGRLLDQLYQLIRAQLQTLKDPEKTDIGLDRADPFVARLAATFRMLGALLWARDADARQGFTSVRSFLTRASPDALAKRATDLAQDILFSLGKEGRHADIFAVSRNRPVELALERSIPAVKADAVSALFAVSCEKIGWAVLDSGIDGSHPAFKNLKKAGASRVVATYDFTRLRQIVLVDHLYNPPLLDAHVATLHSLVPERAPNEIRQDLQSLARDAQYQRPINWSIAQRYIVVPAPLAPALPHGTHVAGILGGYWDEADFTAPPIARRGVCPDIRLFDFRVVGGGDEDSEFALVGALQFIRYLNSRNNHAQIHGANISLSIRHDVRNYACGRTPVCEEAERVVASGVVVVAAAGNRGYQSFHLTDGSAFETYAPSSITDPGNAEAVITVGATHRSSPHSYGVSFFSSRGPTGDGRAKPDLVAPGEKIWSVVPGGTEDALSGTSMAAPHVSGAAAMLMARNPEFVGQSARIKQILCATCTDLGRERSFQGAGMLDILRAMQSV